MDENMNPMPEEKDLTELPEIPEFLKRKPVDAEKIADEPVELERQYVSIEEEGGKEVLPQE